MAGKPNKEILKKQALLALAESRSSLHLGINHARERLSPRSIVENTVRKHGVWVLAGTAIGGFLLTRMLFSGPRKNSRDTSTKSATKRRTIAGILIGSAWGLAREPLLALATQKAMPLAMQYLDKFQTPKPASSHSNSNNSPLYKPDPIE
ncbi:hypothetical protein [Phragmitibacter flavus]|uniref:hypothetical protein n=1 Tax=Phragmitibacter flavus TaxID=2576071 RepID=UPI0010FD432C|nr:hypothetical protein [Phragmitibacter flavus]